MTEEHTPTPRRNASAFAAALAATVVTGLAVVAGFQHWQSQVPTGAVALQNGQGVRAPAPPEDDD